MRISDWSSDVCSSDLKAQQKVEARHFEGRKYLLKYDDVMNDQRKVVFEQRKDLMRAEDVQETVTDMRADVIDALVSRFIPANAYHEQWQVDSLHAEVLRSFSLDLPVKERRRGVEGKGGSVRVE